MKIMPDLIGRGVTAQACITAPPYYRLNRAYHENAVIGLESCLEEYLANIVNACRLIRMLLTDNGTLWLVTGYPAGRDGIHDIAIPWYVGQALKNDGWLLVSDIIWAKPNPIIKPSAGLNPSHDYVLLLAKNRNFYYAADKPVNDVWVAPRYDAGPGLRFGVLAPEIIRECILLGSNEGDTVFDPFAGACTIGEIAEETGRRWFGIELIDYGRQDQV